MGEVSGRLHRLCVERQRFQSLGVLFSIHGRELAQSTVRRAGPQGEAVQGLWCFWYSLFDLARLGGEWPGDDHDVNSRIITQASIAFVSSDKDSKAWASYFQSMGENWLSLPYDARDQKEKLSKAFGVSGIPSLVLLDS